MGTNENASIDRLREMQLLAIVAAGKPGWQRAYADLVDAYGPYLYRRCQRHLRNTDDIEEVLQEVLLKAYCYADRFEGRSSLKTWLTTIADNQCFTHLRQKQRWVQLEHLAALVEIHEQCRVVADPVEDGEKRRLVAGVMAQLSPRSREILSLRYWLDLPLEEIAQTLGIGLSAAKMRLHRAHHQCIEIIDPDALSA